MPDPAVIIPHYNDTKRLIKCLHSLMPQVASGAEVVVIDNGSTDSLDQIRALWPDLRIVTEARKGAANARNRGVVETTAETLFFLDCDCIPAPDWFATAMTLAATADVTGGRIDVFDETPPPRTGAQAFEAVFAFDNRAYVETKGFSVTANLLTRRDVFEATGPFIHGLSEDLDWCRRATALGYRLVYAPELRVSHPSRGDWPALVRKWRRLTEESFGVNGRGAVARAKWGFRALAMPFSSLVHLPRVLTSPALSGPGERLRAAVTLFRLRVLRMYWMLGQALRGR
ncbi:MAG: glycosyltransferase [Pseudotabrizicola sp.]|uniref:glycosyltransferase family 2 protein n=1 Tax=Pseudotabrizicola sp. TaxID=2939647 RepID=UPI002721FBCA|nr:glycosyltransferase [Pseudotabrizicola sp.]MDO9640852.1 glycosyltransferase [Pseudotabrizicola sp.]